MRVQPSRVHIGACHHSATFWAIPLLLLFWLTRGRRRPVRAVLGGLILYAGLLAAAAVIYGRF